MMNVKEFLEYIIEKNEQKQDISDFTYKVIGTGNFSVVFSLGDVVYKISKEQSLNDALISVATVNKLAEQGVNVPYTYSIVTSKEDESCIKNIRDIANDHIRKKTDFLKEIKQFIENYQVVKEKSIDVCSIIQQRIPANRIFYSRMHLFEEFDKISVEDKKFIEANWDNLPPEYQLKKMIIERAIVNVIENLQKFERIPIKHYERFIQDGLILAEHKIGVDNINKSNFKYSKKDGFFFIDLDGLASEQNKKYQALNTDASSAFNYTIDNVFRQIEINSFLYDETMVQKTLKIGAKIATALKNVYLKNLENKFITDEIKKYTQKIMEDPLSTSLGSTFKIFSRKVDQNVVATFVNRYEDCLGIISGKAIAMQRE